jgi:DNA-directed RNA polymerase subunit M
MQFCPKCGLLLVQKRKRFSCPKCGRTAKEKVKIVSSEKMGEKTKVGLFNEKEASVWPVASAVCPKCGNKKAYFWETQTRATDESETRFFRCVKCKYTWREYA